jgi:LppP/LprE lipoprotein
LNPQSVEVCARLALILTIGTRSLREPGENRLGHLRCGTATLPSTRGHTRNCRLYWVQVKPTNATAASPVQLLFFDHNVPLGTPTPNPKPHTTVLSATDDVVSVQYQWPVAGDSACCPTGKGTVQ